ncbi:MAG: tripartite tricarboxylate transporter substrate binding protein [Betaproteobacteria bacterium]|nr:tripartite tricarboxylate transporter substrate binding protein [Betaproteobacteria bacterium]
MTRGWQAVFGLPVAAALLAAALPLCAQTYPTRPVRIVVPFSPGGATDVPGRIVAQRLSEAFGQQVIIDNRPGAGSMLGADAVAKAPPDGYTLLLTATTHVISAGLYKKVPYDAVRDFAPVMLIGSGPNVLTVHPSLPAKSVRELIALAKARPNKIDYASSGNGSAQHLFGALFLSMANITMMHIPYKGSAPATTDLISGQVSVGFPGIALVLPHSKSGRLRALAVTSEKRSKTMPEVPAIAEAGVPGYAATLWLGLLAPKGTPPEIIQQLYVEISKLLRQPDVESTFLATGNDVTIGTANEFGLFLKAEFDKWAKIIKAVDAQVN